MFGYIKKSKIIKTIEEEQEKLRQKETKILLTTKKPETESEVREFLEITGKLSGAIEYLEYLKNKFK